jgi:aerobic carbon-monoxide dehydrogenase small subunit
MIETGFRLNCLINGSEISRVVPPSVRLLDLLRMEMGLTGVKPGCEVGRCGSCMVLVDGEPMNACLLMAYQCSGKHIVTIEGVSEHGLHPVQQALLTEGGLQCGYCTPGMVISLKALFDRCPSPAREEVHEALGGNLCRCTGYEGIIRAAMGLSAKNAAGCGKAQEGSKQAWSIEQLNAMGQSEFVDVLGGVFELSPWIASAAWEVRPFQSAEELYRCMSGIVGAAGEEAKLLLLRSHPDLGARIRMSGESQQEQSGAGLDRLEKREYRYMRAMNRLYRSKHGFPFIIAVKGKTKEHIIAAMRERIRHATGKELDQALQEAGNIARFRLYELVRS